MHPKITISLVTYNAGEDIRLCLHSLKKQINQDFDLIVVDNNSEDNTVTIINKIFPSAMIISLESNIGFGSAHNLAISRANTDWVLVLNQDVVLESNALESLLVSTDKPNIGCIGPLLYRKDRTIDTTGLKKTWYYSVTDRDQGLSAEKASSSAGYAWGISAACALYRIKALNDIAYQRADRSYPEYFDESFFMYKEDVDLAARLNAHHWRSWYAPESRGMHDRTGIPPKHILKTISHREAQPEYINANSYKNHLYFLIKNVPILYVLPVSIYELLKFIYLALHERSTLKQLLQVKQNLSLMLKRRYV